MKAIVWSKYNCTFCDQAKALLTARGIQFEERKIGDGYSKEELLEAVPNARSVPQIFINENHIGGYVELERYLEETSGGFGKGRL
jgi:glutaredoxin 3